MKHCFGGDEERSGGSVGVAWFSIADDADAACEGDEGQQEGRERLSHGARIHECWVISRGNHVKFASKVSAVVRFPS